MKGLWLSWTAQQLPRWLATGTRTPRARRGRPRTTAHCGSLCCRHRVPPGRGPWPDAHSPHTVSPTPGPGQAPSVSPDLPVTSGTRDHVAQVKWPITGLLPESPGGRRCKVRAPARARQGRGGPATASAAESRAGLAPQTARQQLGLLGVPIRSQLGHTGPTLSALRSPRSSGRGDPHTAHPHARGHPDPAPCRAMREKLLRPGSLVHPRWRPRLCASNHVAPQLPNRGGSTRRVTQRAVGPRGGPTPPGLLSCSNQPQEASSARRGSGWWPC